MRNASRALRNTGLKPVGNVPWGTHFCIFYETKQDLLDILVPYFRAGLTGNELCLWIVAPYEIVSVTDAQNALGKVCLDLDQYCRSGKIDIVPHQQWFGVNGSFDTSKAIARFRKKLIEAQRRGLDGLRVNGSSAWVRKNAHPPQFREFERDLDTLIASQQMIVACTFPLALSKAGDILDAARTHQFAVTVRKGIWKRVEIADIQSAHEHGQKMCPNLQPLTARQREILQRVAEGQNTKQIAGLLEISIKTVEAHRLQLMRRLRIDNVPGLVRFAIRTGLVSPEV